MIPRTKKMGYEELHEMLKHLAPEPRHMPTIDETCMFLGAIKRGSHFNVEEEEDILHLTVHEFAEYPYWRIPALSNRTILSLPILGIDCCAFLPCL